MQTRLTAMFRGCIVALLCAGGVSAAERPDREAGMLGRAILLPDDSLRLGLDYRPEAPAANVLRADDIWTPALTASAAWIPGQQFRLALDVQWSILDRDQAFPLGSAAALLEPRDSWDYRLGAAWEFQPGWHLRGGYKRMDYAPVSPRRMPSGSDSNGQSLDLGIGRSGRQWSIDVIYEYTWANTVRAAGDSPGFFDSFQNGQHLGGITATYRY